MSEGGLSYRVMRKPSACSSLLFASARAPPNLGNVFDALRSATLASHGSYRHFTNHTAKCSFSAKARMREARSRNAFWASCNLLNSSAVISSFYTWPSRGYFSTPLILSYLTLFLLTLRRDSKQSPVRLLPQDVSKQ